MNGPLHTPESAQAAVFASAAELQEFHPGWRIRDDRPIATRAGIDLQANTWGQLDEKMSAQERM